MDFLREWSGMEKWSNIINVAVERRYHITRRRVKSGKLGGCLEGKRNIF